jgi:putative transcriptional regulator
MKTTKTKTKTEAQGAGPRAARTSGGTRPGGSAGSKILAAIEEATEVLRSEGLASQRLTVRTYKVGPDPILYRPEDVKRVRERLGVSQAVLAQFLGVNVNTVRSWEQGKRPPQPIARRFLAEIEARPGYWRRRLARQAKGKELVAAPSAAVGPSVRE